MGIRLTTEEFIERSISVHGYRYDYSKVEYITSSIKVNIICKIHGEFQKIPHDHLEGSGCTYCSGNKIFLPNLSNIINEDGSKLIPLNNSKYAIVDANDYDLLSSFRWYYRGGYAKRWEDGSVISMHRFIMNISDSKIHIDHKNRNSLDNRRNNLRTCTHSQNMRNMPPNKKASSKYKGVSWNKSTSKWDSRINFNKGCFYLGGFENEIDAAKAYDIKARELHKEFAFFNFPENNCNE